MSIVCIVLAVVSIIYGIAVSRVGSGSLFFLIWFVIGAALLLFGIVEGLISRGFRQQGKPNLDYIIVLGAQVREDGPSKVCKFRLDRAITYLEENPETLCIVSGGQGSNEPRPEAEVMADYLIEHGIPESRIIRESESKTTAENISKSRLLMPEGASVGIVTNNFHVYRGVMTAHKYGLSQACGIAAESTKFYLPHNMLREFFAVVKYFIL